MPLETRRDRREGSCERDGTRYNRANHKRWASVRRGWHGFGFQRSHCPSHRYSSFHHLLRHSSHSRSFYSPLFIRYPFAFSSQISLLFVLLWWKRHLGCSRLVHAMILWVDKFSNLLVQGKLNRLVIFCVQIRQRDCWLKQLGMGPSLWCFQKRLWEGTHVVPILVFLSEIARPREERSFASIILQPLMCLVRPKIKHKLQFSC